MAPKRATRSNTAPKTTNTTSVTNAQLQAMIDQGITTALAARDANRSTNGDDNHNLGTGVRRTERTAHECTYTDFLKCQPLNSSPRKSLPSISMVGHDALTELALLCGAMFLEESDELKNYDDGLPDTFNGSTLTESKRKFGTPQGTLKPTTTTTEQEVEHWQGLYCRTGEKKQYVGI
ncbi:hypothetical protein Tco_0266356 [Tanacetum coccineum]